MPALETQDILRIAKNQTRMELELVYNEHDYSHAMVHLHGKTYQCSDVSLPVMLVIDSDLRDITKQITLYRQHTQDNSYAVIVTFN